MGWDFTYQASKKDIVEQLTKRKENKSGVWETMTHTVRGNLLWMVEHYTDKDMGNKDLYIVCALLKNQPGYGWGYKDMTESQHPYYYSCPLTYLNNVPETCAEWREQVRHYHERVAFRKHKISLLNVGDTLVLQGSTIPYVKVATLKPLRGEYQGKMYRIPPRYI